MSRLRSFILKISRGAAAKEAAQPQQGEWHPSLECDWSAWLSLIGVIEREIVKENDSKANVRSLEFGREWLERIRCVYRRHRRIIQRTLSGRSFERGVRRRNAPVAVDLKSSGDQAFVA